MSAKDETTIKLVQIMDRHSKVNVTDKYYDEFQDAKFELMRRIMKCDCRGRHV